MVVKSVVKRVVKSVVNSGREECGEECGEARGTEWRRRVSSAQLANTRSACITQNNKTPHFCPAPQGPSRRRARTTKQTFMYMYVYM